MECIIRQVDEREWRINCFGMETGKTILKESWINGKYAFLFAKDDTAAELLGKQRGKRKPWVTHEILDLCDQRRDLKKKRGEPEGAKDYREIKRKIHRDEDGKRDLDTGSMPGSKSMPQKE